MAPALGKAPAARVGIVLQGILSFAFLYAGGAKWLAGPGGTQAALVAVGVTHPKIIVPFSRLLPYFEIGLGLWLLTGFAGRLSAWVATAVLAAFTSSLFIVGLTNGWQQPCNCLGPSAGGTVAWALLRNVLLLGLSSALLVGTRTVRPQRHRPAQALRADAFTRPG